MTFKPENLEEFLTMFEEVKYKIRNFEGCQHLELMQGYEDKHVLSTYSIWQTNEALNNYRHSELFKQTWAKTKVFFDAKPIAFSLKEFIKVEQKPHDD
jgi:heme-degrading monooxygenase HmoA